jgi:hypothetical protein
MKTKRAFASVAHVAPRSHTSGRHYHGKVGRLSALSEMTRWNSQYPRFTGSPRGRGSLSFSNIAASTTVETADEIERITGSPQPDSNRFFGRTKVEIEVGWCLAMGRNPFRFSTLGNKFPQSLPRLLRPFQAFTRRCSPTHLREAGRETQNYKRPCIF